MAAGPFIVPDKSILNIVSATDLLALTAANYRVSLHGSGWTPDDTTNEVYADVTNEIANGNGYVTGGATPSNVTLTRSGSTVKFTFDPVPWTASGGNIPAWRHAVVRYQGTVNGKVNPIVCRFVGDTTAGGTDVPATTPATSPLTIAPPTGGVVTITRGP